MFNGKAILIFLCIFLAGGVAGHFTGLRLGCAQEKKKPEPTAQVQNQPRRPVEEWSVRFQKLFVEKVGITPEQKTQLDPFIQTAQTEFRRVREQSFQEMGNITEQLDAQVMALLTDEQKPKYDQLIKERLERFRKKDAERAAAAAAAARGEPPPQRGDRPPMPPPGEKTLPPTAPPTTPPPPPAPAPAETSVAAPKTP
jgi:Spy/CpxP family protein refolding chaperone